MRTENKLDVEAKVQYLTVESSSADQNPHLSTILPDLTDFFSWKRVATVLRKMYIKLHLDILNWFCEKDVYCSLSSKSHPHLWLKILAA